MLNQIETSLPSVDTYAGIGGDFGLPVPPRIVSVVADDPDNGDVVYSNQDTLTITFDRPSNTPPADDIDQVELFLNFLSGRAIQFGNVTGVWKSTSVLVLTVTDASIASLAPDIGQFRVATNPAVFGG